MEIKEVKNETKEKNKKNKELKSFCSPIYQFLVFSKEYLKQKEENVIEDLEEKIDRLENMNIIDYLNYTKELYQRKRKKKKMMNQQ